MLLDIAIIVFLMVAAILLNTGGDISFFRE